MTILNKIIEDLKKIKGNNVTSFDVKAGIGIAIEQIEKYLPDEKEAIQQAHMAGQKDAGVDPSAYEALVYFENKVEATILTDGD